MTLSRQALAWRCRRGTRELDLLLQAYLHQSYDGATEQEQMLFADLLDLPDPELHRLLFLRPPDIRQEFVQLVSKIRADISI